MSAYYIMVWIRCEAPDCDATSEMMIRFDQAVYQHVTTRPPGWTHKGYLSEHGTFDCYGGSALCPTHSPPDDGQPRCAHGEQ